jgi:DeoR family transcriptional regulator of aga operon
MPEPVTPATVRRTRLADAIRTGGFLRVTDAAARLGVSEVTVRGDLAALEATGTILRVHGGAMPRTGSAERSLESSAERDVEAKRAIGRAAAAAVASGQSVFLDVGSTALAVAHALVERLDLTDVLVITNGLSIALALEPAIPRLTVIVSGGTLRPLQHSLVAPFAGASVESLTCDLAILGCNGVHVERGVTNVNLPETDVKRRVAAAARRTIVVADRTKLGATSLGVIAPIAEIDALITDSEGREVDDLRSAGLAVTVAGSTASGAVT